MAKTVDVVKQRRKAIREMRRLLKEVNHGANNARRALKRAEEYEVLMIHCRQAAFHAQKAEQLSKEMFEQAGVAG